MTDPDMPSSVAGLVRQLADTLADDACQLAEAAESAWSRTAIEDTVEAIDTLVEALSRTSPDAARLLAPAASATTALLLHLGIETVRDQEQQVRQSAAASTTRRSRRRGLGHGYQGIRIPPR